MDQWLLEVTSDPAAKGSAKDLEVAGAGPVHCHFPLPPSFLTMCSSERCLSCIYLSPFPCKDSNMHQACSLVRKWGGEGSCSAKAEHSAIL